MIKIQWFYCYYFKKKITIIRMYKRKMAYLFNENVYFAFGKSVFKKIKLSTRATSYKKMKTFAFFHITKTTFFP